MQCQIDQLSIADVADPDPQDRWTIVPCGPPERKVTVLGDEYRRPGNGLIPNLPVGSCQQSEVDKVNRLTAGLAQCLCQRRRKLRIDQKQQVLFRRDDGVVRLARGKGQNRIDIRVLEIGIILKYRLARLAGRHQAKNVCDGDAQAANAWPAVHAIGIDRYSLQQI